MFVPPLPLSRCQQSRGRIFDGSIPIAEVGIDTIEIVTVLQVVPCTQWPSLTHPFPSVSPVERLPVSPVEDSEGRFDWGVGEFFECISRGFPSGKSLG